MFESFVLAESSDTGKPLALARALDVPRAVANLRFFSRLARHANADEVRSFFCRVCVCVMSACVRVCMRE